MRRVCVSLLIIELGFINFRPIHEKLIKLQKRFNFGMPTSTLSSPRRELFFFHPTQTRTTDRKSINFLIILPKWTHIAINRRNKSGEDWFIGRWCSVSGLQEKAPDSCRIERLRSTSVVLIHRLSNPLINSYTNRPRKQHDAVFSKNILLCVLTSSESRNIIPSL